MAEESKLEKYFCRRVREQGGFTRKLSWIGVKGAPDRMVGFPHFKKHFLVELKASGKDLEAYQLREIKRLQSVGFEILVIKSEIMVECFLYQVLRSEKNVSL